MNNGLYLILRGWGREEADALEGLLALMPGLGYDTLILEVGGHFAYTSHPEAREDNVLVAADVKRLVSASNQHGLRMIPAYNCLGHQSHREKAHALLRAHPEFNEQPDLNFDNFSFVNFYSWCPRHPDVWPFVFDLLDELVDAFDADGLHVGMDEVFVIGECPRCRATGVGDLFAETVNRLHSHVVERRGLEMLMWGDRLLPPSLGYSHWESSHNETHTALDKVPRDIVMCDWHYEIMPDQEYPSVAYFQEKGFRVWPAGCYHLEAVKRLIEVSVRDATPLMLGYLATFWWEPSALLDRLTARVELSDPPSQIDRAAACVAIGAGFARSNSFR